MLMTFDESINACKNIDDWKFVTSFSVGGFEWTGFSKENPNKLIIISSQKTTILDCVIQHPWCSKSFLYQSN